MADAVTLTDADRAKIQEKKVEIQRARLAAQKPQDQPGSGGFFDRAARVIRAGAEGFKEGFGGPVQGASPFVEKNLIGNIPIVSQVNRAALETLPAALQTIGKTIGGGIGALTSAGGQAAEEMGAPRGTRENVEGLTKQVEQWPLVSPETALTPGIAATKGGVVKQFRPPSSQLEEGAKTAAGIVGARGATIPAQKLTQGRWLDMASNIASTSVLGGSRMRAADLAADRAATSAVEDFSAGLVKFSTKEDVGEVLKSAVNDAGDAFRAATSGAYDAVDKAMAYETNGAYQGIVDMRPVKAELSKAFGEIKAGLDDPEGYGMLKRLADKPDFVTFKEAQLIRSDLMGIGRTSTEVISGRMQSYGKRLSPFVDKAMEAAASEVGPDAVRAWRTANAMWKEGKETFNSDVIKAVANKDPEAVYQSVVRNGRPGSIRRVREQVSPQAWEKVRGQFVNDIVTHASDALGNVSGNKLMSAIKRANDGGIYSEVLNDPEIAGRFRDLARTLQIVQGSNDTGALKLKTTVGGAGIGSLPEGGALYMAYRIGLPATLGQMAGQVAAGAILITPYTLARILTNPNLSRWLIDGIGSTGLKGDQAAQRLIVGMVGAGLVDKDQSPARNMMTLNASTAQAIKNHLQSQSQQIEGLGAQ